MKKKLKLTVKIVAQDSYTIKIILQDSSKGENGWYRNVIGLLTLGTLTLQVDNCWKRFNRPPITESEKREFELAARKFLIDHGVKVIRETTWVEVR